ncbi:MAG: UbiD family decarboxylase, partial [Chloroflexi bacterium]|nr:UbiD family decarboxylase [Chloroflexota bacterium]
AWSTGLDPMIRANQPTFNSRAIIDACRPWEWMSEFPAVSESSPELVAKVREKWADKLEL